MRKLILTMLFGALLAVPLQAQAVCTTNDECTSAIPCSLPELCVAGVCIPGDTNGNGVCDADDAEDGSLQLTRMVAKFNTSFSNDNSLVKGKGDFLSEVGFRVEEGLTLRVQDDKSVDPLDTSFSWTPAECVGDASRPIVCVTADRKKKIKVKPIRLTPNVYVFSFKVGKLALPIAPFQEPLRVTLTGNTHTNRVGLISDCKVIKSGLKCREF